MVNREILQEKEENEIKLLLEDITCITDMISEIIRKHI